MRLTFWKVCARFTCLTLIFQNVIWSLIIEFMLPLICDTQALWQKIGHFIRCYEKAARGSKFDLLWINAYITGGISSLSVWRAEDLNLTGRGSGRWASAHAPTFHDLINFYCLTICFYWTYKHNNCCWERWSLAVPYKKVRVDLGTLARNLVWPLSNIQEVLISNNFSYC